MAGPPWPTKLRRNEMTRNVGTWERVLRIVIGIVLLALVVIGPKTWWGLVGVIPLATALWGW
jgi:hypothetical protein